MTIERAALWIAASAFTLAFALCCHAQISLEASREPAAVTSGLRLPLDLMDLRICNDSPNPRSNIFEERIFMAKWQAKETGKPSGIEFLTAAHARRVLEAGQAKNKKQIAADLISTGLEIAVPLFAWDVVAASKTVIGAAAAGGSVARIIQGRLQAKVPSIAIFNDELLTGPLGLAPAACTTRTVFAAKMRKAQVVVATIP